MTSSSNSRASLESLAPGLPSRPIMAAPPRFAWPIMTGPTPWPSPATARW
jgi:hypothetical protein